MIRFLIAVNTIPVDHIDQFNAARLPSYGEPRMISDFRERGNVADYTFSGVMPVSDVLKYFGGESYMGSIEVQAMCHDSGRVLWTDTIRPDNAGCFRVELTEVVRWWYPGSKPHQGGGVFVASGSEVFTDSDTSFTTSSLSQLHSISLNYHTVRRAYCSLIPRYRDVKVVPQVEFKFVARNMLLPPVMDALMTQGVTSRPDTVIVYGLRRTDARFDARYVLISNMKIEKVVVQGSSVLEWTPNTIEEVVVQGSPDLESTPDNR
jgi:hypothetical protein